MPQTEKIAISLPRDLMRKLEQARKKTGETRSAFIRRAIERSFRESQREERIRAYLEGYQNQPETTQEVAEAEAAARVIATEPW